MLRCYRKPNAPHEVTAGQVAAIDGKTLRQVFDEAAARSAIPEIGARPTAHHIGLGKEVA